MDLGESLVLLGLEDLKDAEAASGAALPIQPNRFLWFGRFLAEINRPHQRVVRCCSGHKDLSLPRPVSVLWKVSHRAAREGKRLLHMPAKVWRPPLARRRTNADNGSREIRHRC